ncbi:MAG: ABC transporter permease [Cyclobacteriaceae bacterium]|nr:ABC transporter permease [Cyclobacteriaceae bacterium HetDA_MAG_MS6]
MDNRPGIFKWIEKFCASELVEGIMGDLDELYAEDKANLGPKRAKFRLYLRALTFLRPIFYKGFKPIQNPNMMIWIHYFRASWRSIKRYRQNSMINLIGLTLAITCALLMSLLVVDEYSFDKMHRKKENIFRLYKKNVNPVKGSSFFTAETSGLMGPEIVKNFPEATHFVRINPWFDDIVLSYEDRHFQTAEMIFADSSIFDVFDFKLLQGNPKTALKRPSSIVLTQTFAQKLFGEEDPINKTIKGINDLSFTVTGVVEDAPRTSHIQFEALVSWTTTTPGIGPLNYVWMNNWLSQSHYTYLLLSPGSDARQLAQKANSLIAINLAERKDNYFFHLQSLSDIHLKSDEILYTRKMKIGSHQFVLLLAFSGLLILIIASVNYINISLAKATKNIKEVGLRKVIGSSRRQVILRFLSETFMLTLMAVILSLILVYLLLPEFNVLIDKDIPFSSAFKPSIVTCLLGFLALISVVIDLYPAWVISAYSPAMILKGANRSIRVGSLRKILLGIQYTVSITLIICTLLIIRQIDYLKSQTLTIDGEKVMVINLNNEVGEHGTLLGNRLRAHSNITSASLCQAAVGGGTFSVMVIPSGQPQAVSTRIFRVDTHFAKTYGITILEGQYFRPDVRSDSNSVIVNEAFVKYMGWETALDKTIQFQEGGTKYPIMATVEDFHVSSPAKNLVSPGVMYLHEGNQNNLSIRLGQGNVEETLDFIQENWDALAERTPLSYSFVDEWYDRTLKAELRMVDTSVIFTIISILLCGLGLYGLSALMLEQKIKEISIRKVLGASVGALVAMTNRQFVLIILISFVIASAAAFWFNSSWIVRFPYQIDFDLSSYLLAGISSLLLSIGTVSLLAYRASVRNPAITLKDE